MSGTSSPTAVHTDEDALGRAGLARALTSTPIMTRGAALALGTSPRTTSLVGTQLNASGGDSDIDPRIYINPSLPWSAVVLGQQGSGRSHTAACLLESCIVADARSGTAPAPMASLVCTYDDIDIGQPSKFVSVALSDAGEKVTVLAAPRRLKHMRKVYSAFKHVSVLPLSLRTTDINPSLLLQIFENQPPRLQRWVRSKCLKAADAVTFAALLKDAQNELSSELRESFTQATECLEDLIHEDSPSVTLHFESGRLLVVDLTDPYITPQSAATVTAILTHAFACWNNSRDKVLVLENTDAYLPSSPILQRQLTTLSQRTGALNLRILVNAHEPSESIGPLMRNASFVLEHHHTQAGPEATPLCPGEALLISPNAVVLDNEGEPTLLGARPMVVSVRTRFTGSPVSHVPLLEVGATADMPVIPPPPPEPIPQMALSAASMPDLSMPQPTRLISEADFFLAPNTATDVAPEKPAPPAGKRRTQQQHADSSRSTANPHPPPPANAQPPPQTRPAPSKSNSSSDRVSRNQLANSHPPPAPTQPQPPSMIWTPPQSRRERQQYHKVTMEELEEEPEFRIVQALDSAAAHILEQVASRKTTPQHGPVSLPNMAQQLTGSRQRHPSNASSQTSGASYLSMVPQQPLTVDRSVPPRAVSVASSAGSGSGVGQPAHKRFSDLVNVMESFAARGESRPSRSDVASAVGESFIGTGFVTFRGYALAAEKAGLVRRGGSTSNGTEWLELIG